jgi:hypothetical protein
MGEVLELARANILSPPVLAFALGVVATACRSDLKLPSQLYTSLSIYLLLAIGLKGGAELSATSLGTVWLPALTALVLGLVTPVLAYAVLRRGGRFDVANAAAIAAHYGSVSVVTFSAALVFLEAVKLPVEPFVPTLVVILEIPGIVVALAIARMAGGGNAHWGEAIREILSGRSIVLLAGGMVIGLLAGKPGLTRVAPLFVEPFYGIITLFLLEMGMVAARRLPEVRTVGLFLVAFAIGMPLVNGVLGVAAGRLCGLSLGGAVVLGTLSASASYIAAPAAVRIALPQANPSYYLTASLGLTFPFNLTVGIPVYFWVARLLYGGH